jgi:hypothetical protein
MDIRYAIHVSDNTQMAPGPLLCLDLIIDREKPRIESLKIPMDGFTYVPYLFMYHNLFMLRYGAYGTVRSVAYVPYRTRKTERDLWLIKIRVSYGYE